jgi:hypothetical protein
LVPRQPRAAGQRPTQLVFHRVGDTIEFERPDVQID